MAKYRVTSLTVAPTKTEYAPGENIVLNIVCKGERWAENPTEWGVWYGSGYFLTSSGAQVTDPKEHFHESLNAVDGFTDKFSVKLTNPGPGKYADEISVKCWKRL